jgi:diguanylate cyclase (GGDEF)-like protein
LETAVVGNNQIARADIQAAQTAYRKRVRSVTLATLFGLAAVLAVTSVLPTTPAVHRAGLLLCAGFLAIAGIIHVALVRRDARGYGRLFVTTAICQGVMVVMLGLTGGVGSPYFSYYLLPVLVLILSGSWRHATVLGALAGVGLIGLEVSVPFTATVRDMAVTRLFQLGTITFFAAATATATGETRRALAARGDTLASQRDDAFHMAATDELTGLYNRHFMREELRRMTARASRRDRPFAVIALDVDGLKAVNDSRGHQAGDDLLRGIAEALRDVLRVEDIAVRLGGDEFVALLPDADRGEAVKVAYRIRQRIVTVAEHGSVSTGIAVWRRGDDPDETLREADLELYRSKAARAVGA